MNAKARVKVKSHQAWSWVIIVTFFLLSVFNFYFGLAGVLCMTLPIYHAVRGRGKIHCSHYCPRGSFLGKWLQKISLRNSLPAFMRTTWFKNALLAVMISMLTMGVFHSGGDFFKLGFVLFRFMLMSFVVGIVMGVFYQPRSWCQVCPMGHATGIIAKAKSNK